MKKNSICVVGAGKWGKNHIRTLLLNDISVGCVEIDEKQLTKIKSSFRLNHCYSTIEEAINEDFDGYIIATPPNTHAELSKKIISNRKPVLVEKPLCLNVKEAEEIKHFLKKYNSKLVVGHLMLFHPAIKKIKSLIDKGSIGKIQYIYSNRLNLGTVRTEENVFWSFAPHDISLFQYFTDSFPDKVISHGSEFLQKNIHDSTVTYLKYPENIEGHIYVSWLHPFKEHRIVVIGSEGSIHYEDSAKNKPLLFYENFPLKNQKNSAKNKKPKSIKYDPALPLDNILKYFINIVDGQNVSLANINEGIDNIKILEMASKSLNSN